MFNSSIYWTTTTTKQQAITKQASARQLSRLCSVCISSSDVFCFFDKNVMRSCWENVCEYVNEFVKLVLPLCLKGPSDCWESFFDNHGFHGDRSWVKQRIEGRLGELVGLLSEVGAEASACILSSSILVHQHPQPIPPRIYK